MIGSIESAETQLAYMQPIKTSTNTSTVHTFALSQLSEKQSMSIPSEGCVSVLGGFVGVGVL